MKISVCMATYQGEQFVAEQLDSILTQLRSSDEVIISDDCSTDRTVEVIKAIADPRIRVVRNIENVGYSKNFERALSLASGAVVFVADQDDVWMPDKVSRMLEALQVHDLAVHDVRVVDGSLNTVADSHFRLHDVRLGFAQNVLRTRYIGSAMAMHRKVLDKALPLPQQSDLCAYDYWLAIVAEAFFDVGLVRRPLMLYRRHGATASTGGGRSAFPVAHRIAVRLYCLAQLVRRSVV